MAELLLKLGEHDKALTTVDHALSLDVELVRAWQTKAAVLRALGRDAEADEAERHASALEAVQQA